MIGPVMKKRKFATQKAHPSWASPAAMAVRTERTVSSLMPLISLQRHHRFD
jgi:hypothetical protein